MRYDLRYRSTYAYPDAVPFAQHLVRMLPSDNTEQTVLLADLSIAPAPSEREERRDFFGNREVWIALDTPHHELEIRLLARIEVHRRQPSLYQSAQPWTHVRDEAAAVASMAADSPAHFLFASPLVGFTDELRAYAAGSFEPERAAIDAGLALARRIKSEFRYRPGATTTRTTARQALAMQAGVCQDFAHVMIAGLRALGLPAAYVSGFLCTKPPPGQARLEGADAMHAWVKIWAGDAQGWVGIDPTNGILVGQDHIEVAFGRDYADVAPVDGIIIASGEHTSKVAADVIPMG